MRTGLQQSVDRCEKVVGVVSRQMVVRVELPLAGSRRDLFVDDGARGVGRPVLAVGAA